MPLLERILVPLDGSAVADGILAQVSRLLLRKDADVVLFRVVPEKLAGVKDARGESALDVARTEAQTRATLLSMQGAKVRPHVVVGDPAERILAYAAEWLPSVIALSTHGRSGLSRWVRGSVAERVLRGSRWPVLLVNPHGIERGWTERAERRFKRILVPLDGSDESASALPVAREIAELYESEVVLFHAVEVLVGEFPAPSMVVEPWNEAEAMLADRRSKLGPLPIRTKVVAGHAAAAIIDTADEEKADLLVMATHGRSGMSRWVFGSVAEQVLRHARVPLLAVPSRG